MFEHITIVKESYIETPDFCRGTSDYYEIYEDGTVIHCVCSECHALDKNIDEDHIAEVVKILKHTLEMIRKKYGK